MTFRKEKNDRTEVEEEFICDDCRAELERVHQAAMRRISYASGYGQGVHNVVESIVAELAPDLQKKLLAYIEAVDEWRRERGSEIPLLQHL